MSDGSIAATDAIVAESEREGAKPVAAPRRVLILLNKAAGTAARTRGMIGEQIAAECGIRRLEPEIIDTTGQDLTLLALAALASESASRPDAVIAAGGDGTIRAVAEALAGTEMPLGVLALGTFNHFARDLGLPGDLPGMLDTIAEGVTTRIDVAEVNGLVFVNNSSVGLYPVMVRQRDRQIRRNRRAKWLAMAIAWLRVLRRPRIRRLTITADGVTQPHRTPFAFVGNNLYSLDPISMGQRACLHDGRLCLFIATAGTIWGFLRLLCRALLGRLDRARDFQRLSASRIIIRSRRHRLTVSLDGEIRRLRSPLDYRIRPGALRVYTRSPPQ